MVTWAALLTALAVGPPGAAAQLPPAQPAAEGLVAPVPPSAIAGLDAPPLTGLEFSRAWLARADAVRQRRALLESLGLLDRLSPRAAAAAGAALTGTLRVPIIPVTYADVPIPFSERVLYDRVFGASRGDTLSFADYWSEVSGDLLRAEGTVTSWVRLPRGASHYLSASEYGWARFGRMAELRQQVLKATDLGVDFGEFDNDGPDGRPNSGDDDGYVDFVVFAYAQSCPGDGRSGAIWPHRGAMPPFETDDAAAGGDRIRIADYLILPAMDPATCAPMHIGLLAHEAGHALGLPDLYDYDGSSQGIGAWGLMGTGSHGERYSPAHLEAWSKEQLGWVEVRWIDADSERIEVPPVETSRTVLRYDMPGDEGRYALIENRQRIGSDRHLPGTGLLVWEVDPERGELGAWNTDEAAMALRLLQADGRPDLEAGRIADGGDPFPGTTSRRRATLTDGGLSLSSIHERGSTVTAIAEPAVVASVYAPGAHRVGAAPRADQPAGPFAVATRTDGGTTATVVASDLLWSWGLAASAERLLLASYGWDALGLRPRPRLLEVSGGDEPGTLSRLPADALYSPVTAADGSVYVLARARGDNSVFRVRADGSAELVAARVARGPAYGMTLLPDGGLLVAGWDGTLTRVDPARGTATVWLRVATRLYQIAADAAGNVYAATYAGAILRISPRGDVSTLFMFEQGRAVAITAAPDGAVYVAERGGDGRILRLRADAPPALIARVPGAEFYGLAVTEDALFAVDLKHSQLLRFDAPADAAPGFALLEW